MWDTSATTCTLGWSRELEITVGHGNVLGKCIQSSEKGSGHEKEFSWSLDCRC